MDKSFPYIKVILYILIFVVYNASCTCSGFVGVGYTYPVGDIIIEYGTSTPLEITCVITDETKIMKTPNISSMLYFKKDESFVSSSKIIRLNETSIKLVEENPEKMASFYKCMLNDKAICFNTVSVGTKPLNVTDFKCISHNYENLTCTFTPPKNFVPTNYSLSYTFPRTRSGSRPTDCNITDDKPTGKKKCFWGMDTTPHYRQVQPQYNFTLLSENKFGSVEQIFLFDHFKNIRSEPPENLTCINQTTSSLFLWWKVPRSIFPFPLGLEHRIMYYCHLGPKIWQEAAIIVTKQHDEVTYNLTGLKHAHDVCDVRVAIRVAETDIEEMWSANSSVNAYTSSTIPGAAPKANIGSFQTEIISSLRDIYVYWQQIPVEIKNADNFEYVVSAWDGISEVKKIPFVTNSYAKFSNMSLDTPYRFYIQSKNSEGLSEEATIISVPSNDNIVIGEPVAFTKVAFDNGLYKLSWERPKRGAEHVENYALFWCSNERDRPFQCAGYLNWTEVSANTTEYNITVMDNLTTQFAISANNATSSSGMVWATCTIMHNKKITKIKDVWIARVGSTFIELGWKLDCAERGDSVAGYVIYYCPRGKKPVCTKPMNLTINDPNAKGGIVTELTPYTTYRLTVAVLNKQGSQSLESDQLFNTTYEDISTEPYGLREIGVTNSSITLAWDSPLHPNGYLRYYDISYNESTVDTQTNKTLFTLTGLESDTVYNISVRACTLRCSKSSTSILVSTKVGPPGRIPLVSTTHENNMPVLIWSKTEERRRLNLYEILLKYKSSNENITLPVINTTDNKYSLANCGGENGKYSNYYFTIRAVNMDNETRYPGPWSIEQEGSCQQSEQSPMIWVVIAIGCVAFIATLLFSGKRLYIYIKSIRDIEIKLPQGLDPQIGNNWPEHPKQPPSISPGDEERLLHKAFIPRSGDSSGCSSGQESVSSDSGSSITSTSDSGTEHPRTTCEEITESSEDPMPANNAYIQFNNTQDKSPPYVMAANLNSIIGNQSCDQIIKPVEEPKPANSSYVPLSNAQDNSTPYVLAANKNFLMSLNPCDQMMKPTEEPKSVSNSYIPLNNIQEKSPPYVLAANLMSTPCDQMVKPTDEARSVNSTYVQLNNTQENNPPYVLASNKNTLMPNLYYPSVI